MPYGDETETIELVGGGPLDGDIRLVRKGISTILIVHDGIPYKFKRRDNWDPSLDAVFDHVEM